MAASRFALFETPIGPCAIIWSERGVCGVQLPERSTGLTRARVHRQFPEASEAAPSEAVRPVIDGLTALLSGERVDLSFVELDTRAVPEFHRRVYERTRAIPVGATVTYGDIARELGSVGLSRAVGQALGANPFVLVIPCHRVVAADGKNGGFSGAGGVVTKLRLLEIEGVQTSDNLRLF
ncbi:MAG: methylated-DNA--[protein]-cysteine S-methyltransferase [Corynebacteriales bacterium]|nr:methylated-DNA--[protein]-cysteine S-methyltransferase [Mycobacteriales bacterium]